MNDHQKIKAILALVDGVWDDPQLIKIGALHHDTEYNIRKILGHFELPEETMPDFSPASIPTKWDNVEVDPVVMDKDGNCEVADDPEDAIMWSVYLHDVEGGVQCVADVATEKQANDLAALILSAARNFDPEFLKNHLIRTIEVAVDDISKRMGAWSNGNHDKYKSGNELLSLLPQLIEHVNSGNVGKAEAEWDVLKTRIDSLLKYNSQS